jgi:RNA polymerase-interacting CarD/CdnL/TRCF family regulator
MFKKGDTVVHPKHDLCRVIKCGVETVNGTEKDTLVLKPLKDFPGEAKILISTDNLKDAGIRYPLDISDVPEVLKTLSLAPEGKLDNTRDGYCQAERKMDQGNIFLMAEIIRDIAKSKKAVANQQNTKVLNVAREKIISEIAYALKTDQDTVNEMLQTALNENT